MKKIRTLVSTLLICSLALSIAACGGKVTAKTSDEVKDACVKAGFKEDEVITNTTDEEEMLYAETQSVIVLYSKSDAAKDYFDEMYKDAEESLKDKDSFDVDYKLKEGTYVIFDGTSKDPTGQLSDQYMYGGYYYVDGTLISAFSIDKDGVDMVKKVLDALGYPKI